MNLLKRFWHEEEGLETVEYAIILGLIVVGVILTVGSIGLWVSGRFDALLAGLQNPGA
jgi:pilus assembly protein Flp/PilA